VLLSPDGKWAAYPGTRAGEDDANIEGIAHVRALDRPDARGRSLAVKGLPVCWSPSRDRLIVTDFSDDALPQSLVDVATGKRTALKVPALKAAKDGAEYVQFVTDWSQDGKWWLVTCLDQKTERSHLYLTKSDGSGARHLAHLGPALTARF